jgi:predicted acyltransferase
VPDTTPRLLSIDILRGFDMFWIIGGSQAIVATGRAAGLAATHPLLAQFEHVRWQGLHFFDLIWPLFMLLVGVSLTWSTERRLAAGATRPALTRHALVRALILFALGMVTQGRLLDFSLATFRPCYSVLHGIAAGYLVAALVAIHLGTRGRIAATAAFLLGYWALVMLVPVPGAGAGVLTPSGNLPAWVDRLILGRFHFGENTWFLSYPVFGCSILLGVLAGELLKTALPPRVKVRWLAIAGAAAIGLGLLWSLQFPIIKLIWTSSYVLVSGGISALALALVYWMVEIRGWRRWGFPFMVIGMNSIAAYVAMSLVGVHRLGRWLTGWFTGGLGAWGAPVQALAALLVFWLALYLMHRRRIFLRI